MGEGASCLCRELVCRRTGYTDYLYFPWSGRGQMAEALANGSTPASRLEAGVRQRDLPSCARAGPALSRAAATPCGYPACPNVADFTPPARLLGRAHRPPMDESDQLEPEQSHHRPWWLSIPRPLNFSA